MANRVKGGEFDSTGPKIKNYELQQISRDEEGAGSAITQVKQAYMDYPAGNPMSLIRDLVTIRKGQNASLQDVFDAIEFFDVRYTKLHLLHCRVTKKTADNV